MENQQAEFTHMISDVRNRARKLEEENRIHVRLILFEYSNRMMIKKSRLKSRDFVIKISEFKVNC
jgi:replicative DNA helicase